jgi:hypothetical protein
MAEEAIYASAWERCELVSELSSDLVIIITETIVIATQLIQSASKC